MKEKVLVKMVKYFENDIRRIHHFLKVYSLAEAIGGLEGLTDKELEILEIAAITHDIGIKKSLELHGDSSGKHQEELGPEEARKLLNELHADEEIIERVCWLIQHHHTYHDISGMDYQILVEADFLVNMEEDSMNLKEIESVKEKIFRTKTGIDLLDSMFLKKIKGM